MNIDSQRQKPSLPSLASVRLKTSIEPIVSKSVPSTCSTPFTKTSYGGFTCAGRSTRERLSRPWLSMLYTMLLGVRRRAIVLFLAFAIALALGQTALAGNGGLLPAPPHSPSAHRITDAYIFVLV